MELIQRFLPLIILLAIWELAWKGVTLWHSARRRQKGWFVALLLLNTAGILPIVYLLLNPSKKDK